MNSPRLGALGPQTNGNLTRDSLWTNTWNGENRRTLVQSSAAVPAAGRMREQWTYLPDGRWVERIVSTNNGSSYYPAQTNRYVWDGNVLLAVLDEANAVEVSFTRALDLSGTEQGAGGTGGLLWVTAAGEGTHFVCFDGNGNVMALVDASDSSESARYEYGPFSENIRATGPMAQINPIHFSTQYTDDVTGERKYLYRDYRPDIGRWISRDPIEESGGMNWYGLLGNDPVARIDKMGLQALYESPELTFFNDLPVTTGECGFFKYNSTWSLNKASGKADNSIGGLIVQYVDVTFDVHLCGEDASPFHFGPPSKNLINPADWPFYEAWHIPPGGNRPSQRYRGFHDIWAMGPVGDGTRGSITITGVANYFDGYSIPWYFSPGNAGPPNVGLPTSGWFLPPAAPNSTVNRTLIATWDCCCDSKDRMTKVSITPDSYGYGQ